MRDGTAETVSRDQILRQVRGQGNINFPCSADHEQDWQPYPVDPYSCYICVTIHTYIQYSVVRTIQGRRNTDGWDGSLAGVNNLLLLLLFYMHN